MNCGGSMKDAWVVADNIVSPLGFSTRANLDAILKAHSGISLHHDPDIFPEPFYASVINSTLLDETFSTLSDPAKFTRLEKLAIFSISDVLAQLPKNILQKRIRLIISTTKGNIDALEKTDALHSIQKKAFLWDFSATIGRYFDFTEPPIVISNACISGLLAMLIGQRWIGDGRYDHVIVCGADIFSRFVFSGFHAFRALSSGPCKPFDKNRNGLTLGEGAGTVVLSAEKSMSSRVPVIMRGGGSSNDSNHISGPSCCGDGLLLCIKTALSSAKRASVDHVSAHGTATLYNDEMEAKALASAGLTSVPVNSLKGYFGHTLGAAGTIESIVSIHSMKRNVLPGTYGFSELGVSVPLELLSMKRETPVNSCLKTASGFGGCNAAALFEKPFAE